MGGLAPAAPGYQQLLVEPAPGGTLTSASTSLQTGYGPAGSSWTRNGSALTLRVVVPPNTTATVRLAGTVSAPAEAVPQGAGSYALPSGSYTFVAR